VHTRIEMEWPLRIPVPNAPRTAGRALALLLVGLAALGGCHKPASPLARECGLHVRSRLEGPKLRSELRNQSRPTNLLGYGAARDSLYAHIDAKGGLVSGIYTGIQIPLTPGRPRTVLYEAGMSAEHVWPQSYGARDSPQKSDLHNIFPTMEYVNQARGNSPFGEIPDDEATRWYGRDGRTGSLPLADHEDYSEAMRNIFEPREEVKGDIARAMFYFATMWEAEADLSFLEGQTGTLLEWNRQDPPDDREVKRTLGIRRVQGNCNPFVVDEGLAERAFIPTPSPDPFPSPQTVD
jgi:uncharacterized protein